jgi:hypothetical protein
METESRPKERYRDVTLNSASMESDKDDVLVINEYNYLN